ncbi:MBL fold metallo-hydrolase [bacterium]|nr:MBL fold metallo-hydrolase [bacterium]MBO7043844.1 MBL fold metallo-hydrolase [bacterium]
MIKLQYYGKTCFSFLNDDVNVLINPDFTNNEENFKNLDQIKADVIVLTKYKEDLISDVVSIAKHNNATIVCACALADKLRNFGIADDKLIRACVGQRINFQNKVYIHFIQSVANSNLPGTLAMGAIITLDGIKIYHDGLTAYYSDLKLLKDCNIDYALISVSE